MTRLYLLRNLQGGARSIIRKTRAKASLVSIGVVTAISSLALSIAPAAAVNTNTVYDNIPSPTPGNVDSWGFEADAVSEFGGQVQLAGSSRTDPQVTVLMSSWGCQSGHWNTGDCATTPKATFSEPVTLKIYNVSSDNTPGSLVTSKTSTFNIPYRPSADPACGNGKWTPDGGTNCFNGYATPISFNLTGTTLPDKFIVSVAYNTTHYGSDPKGESAACFSSAGGCGYDSLNVGLNYPPTTGTVPNPDDAYQNSSYGGAYCDGGTSGTGTFRLDAGCWTGYQIAVKVAAADALPTNKEQCMNNGWKQYGTKFKNQGDCVSYVASKGKNQPSGY